MLCINLQLGNNYPCLYFCDISYKHYQCDLLNFNVIYSAEVLLKMCWHSALFCHPSLETNDVAVKWKGRRNEGVFLQWIFLFAEC